MDNNTNFRLSEIDREIKKAESDKSSGVVLMVISIFFLWPLFIVGIIGYNKAKKRIDELNDEKRAILFDSIKDK